MGGQEDNGLSLESLAQRLETLERQNERMRWENAELRDEVAALSGSETSQAVEHAFEGKVSRRSLLSKAGAAAVAAVGAGTLLNTREARAHHSAVDDGIFVDFVTTHSVWTNSDKNLSALLAETASDSDGAVVGSNSGSAPGVEGISNGSNGKGVMGTGRYGVWGESNQVGFYGVTGRNTNVDGTGVRGVTNNDGRAGVRGEGSTGVWGSSSKTGFSGVYGQHTGSLGYGVVGDGKGSGAGVLGRNSGGDGVQGEGGNGVHGKATGGYGGLFEGGKAQLRIAPKGTAGRPTTGAHSKGELYMDSAAALFVCTAGGAPGTWRKVTTTAT